MFSILLGTNGHHQSIAYFFSHFQSFGFGGLLPKRCQAAATRWIVLSTRVYGKLVE